MKRPLTVGLIQMACQETVRDNLEVTIEKIRRAAGLGAQIVCTQELFKSPYFPQCEDWHHFELAEDVNADGPTVQRLRALAAEMNIVLIASLFEKRALGLYHNTTVVLDADGRYLGKYRKMHIPDDPQYYEKFYFTPGDLGYKVFQTEYAKIGVLICWDQWFPEAARSLGLQGVEVIFIPTAIGYSTPDEDSSYAHAWQTVQQGHAVANACFLAAVNRVGFEADPSKSASTDSSDHLPDSPIFQPGVGPNGETGIQFWGQSFITDPDGVIQKQASKNDEEILVWKIDLSVIDETKKRFSFPYRDRRVDSYQDLLKLYSDYDG